MTPLYIDDYLSKFYNEAAFPAASLLDLSVDFEDAVNYGRFGWLVAHELSHLFDPLGYNVWTEMEDSQHYQQISKCIENQYGTNKSIEDDFSDISGTQVGFRALKNKLGEAAMKQPPVEGYRFTNEQIYFLSFANFFCQHQPYLDKFSSSTYSRDDIRALNSLKNSRDFAMAFNCNTSSPMNPSTKCTIW